MPPSLTAILGDKRPQDRAGKGARGRRQLRRNIGHLNKLINECRDPARLAQLENSHRIKTDLLAHWERTKKSGAFVDPRSKQFRNPS
jgi:hypothetical protein